MLFYGRNKKCLKIEIIWMNKTNNIASAYAKTNEKHRKCPTFFPYMYEKHMFCMFGGHHIDFDNFAILIFNTNHEFVHFNVCCGLFHFY